MASVVSFGALPYFVLNLATSPRFRVRVQCLGVDDSTVLSSDSVIVNETSSTAENEKSGALSYGGNGRLKSRVEKKWLKGAVSNDLEVNWDDGYGTKTVKDYVDGAREMIRADGGPLRWFCPIECGEPLKESPILLFLPGLDGVGLGLTLHHKALGKVFEVQCLHIPVYDRTPLEGLVKFIEEKVRKEHALFPNKPVYLVGDSFGGCLALAVAARNPETDLVLILANPATSYERSPLQPFYPLLDSWPDGLYNALTYLLSLTMGNPFKMAMVNIEYRLAPRLKIEQFFKNTAALLPPSLSGLADIIPKGTLQWKLKLIKSAAAYVNSRLHAVKAEVLVLSSGNDYMLPSKDEAQRLKNSIKNCTVRHFKENGHTILLEDGINLLTVIKGTSKYRRSRRLDFVSDYVPPSMSEFKCASDQLVGRLHLASGAATFSTLDDGKIVKGLSGVPNEGPVLLVGHHMLMGFELFSLAEAFLREKNIVVRGVAHPKLFTVADSFTDEFSLTDWMKVLGAVPVSASNLFKLLSTKSHVLLYPGGAREALHYRGEEYKLIWPKQQEFVRMAARFGATIVPFGAVGEDDIAELVLDYNDLMKIPVVNDYIRDDAHNSIRIRDESQGEVANQKLFIPVVLPKVPGRFYLLFGKPIETNGKEEKLKDKTNATQLYLQIKSEVENCIAYLLKKREEDPYRSIFDRMVYRALHYPSNKVPAFDP